MEGGEVCDNLGFAPQETWRNGRTETDYIVETDAPLKQEAIDELLKAGAWEIVDGDEVQTVSSIDQLTSVRYRFSRSKSDLEIAQDEISSQKIEIEQMLTDARAGLVALPVDGEAWDATKWYRLGDRVVAEGISYTCQKICKGKAPGGTSTIAYWIVTPLAEQPTPWGDIPSGDTIAVGIIVTHNELTWRCVKEHTKSIVRQPSKVQTDYWEVVA